MRNLRILARQNCPIAWRVKRAVRPFGEKTPARERRTEKRVGKNPPLSLSQAVLAVFVRPVEMCLTVFVRPSAPIGNIPDEQPFGHRN